MLALRQFEVEAIELMAEGVLTSEQLSAVKQFSGSVEYQHTSVGYFITLSHPLLPEARSAVSTPAVVGEFGDVHCGFVMFLGSHALTLECHSWGSEEIPEGFRECRVVVSTVSLPNVAT